MTLTGVYRGTHIVTDRSFPQGQRFLLIPISGKKKINPEKARMIQQLYGSVPDSGLPYEQVKQERRDKQ